MIMLIFRFSRKYPGLCVLIVIVFLTNLFGGGDMSIVQRLLSFMCFLAFVFLAPLASILLQRLFDRIQNRRA